MRWRSPQSLLRSLSDPKSLPQIHQLHQQLLARGHLLRPFFATKFLQLYADAGDLRSARHLFDLLPQPNIFAFTALSALLSRLGSHQESLRLYSLMRRAGVAPDAYALPVALRAAARSARPFAVAALHAEAVRFGASAAPDVRAALVAAYARLGDACSARTAFGAASEGDLLARNALLSAYINAGSIREAERLLGSMRSDGCEPDTVSWNIMMDGYCRAGRCDEALQIFNNRVLRPNVVSWTTLIAGYAKNANHEAAIGVFRRMISESTVPPDQDTLSCVVSSCRHLAALFHGREAHAYGIKSAGTTDSFYCAAGAALVVMYAACGKISAAERVFRMMDPTDLVTWNAVILAFAKSGMGDVALEYFRNMRSRGIRSDEVTLATLIPTCELKPGKQIHAYVIRHNYEDAIAINNALISMYSRSGCIEAARSVFSTMGARDVITWNTMIGGLGSNGLGGQALALLGQMDRAEVQPNSVTFMCALMACSHSGLVDEGLEIFKKLSEHLGLDPTTEQYACIVDLLTRAGRFEEADGLIKRIPMGPNGSVWGAVLAASQAHQNVEFGRLAFEELIRLEPENTGNYVTMSNIYVRARRWEEAKAVRKMMEMRGLVKPSGYSWIGSGDQCL